MDHLAILDKKRKLLAKILSREKTIESRWYKFKKTPYRNISVGDTIYFKDSGEMVTTRAAVSSVLFFDALDEQKIRSILEQYGAQIGIPVSYTEKLKSKNFCTLIFLKKVETIKPFSINKQGYGTMAAWITIDKIEKIRVEKTSPIESKQKLNK